MSTEKAKGPVLIDLENAAPAEGPDSAPPVPDTEAPTGAAMQKAVALAARPARRSSLAKWAWGLGLGLLGAVLSVSAWDFVTGLIARMPLLGYAVSVLMGAFVLVLAIAAIRELAAFSRLARLDRLHRAGAEATVTPPVMCSPIDWPLSFSISPRRSIV